MDAANVFCLPIRDRAADIAEARLGVSLIVSVLTPYVEGELDVSNVLAATVLDELREVIRLLSDESEAA
jgi:hypothetical protein